MTGGSRLTGVLRHPAEPRVLLLRSDRTWRLPRVTVREPMWIADAVVVVPAFERRLGTRPWLLRQLSFTERDDKLDAVHELALVDERWQPPGHGRWVARDDVERLRLDEGERSLVAAYLDTFDAVPPERPPWSRLGWRDEVVAWLEGELARLGRRLVAVEQVKQWSISSVLRVETDRRELYFKVSARLPLFAEEAAVTARLAERFPGYVPAPVAIEPLRSWVLFRPFDVLGWDARLDERAELFRRFAELQLRTVELTDELLSDGCLDRRLGVLERHLDELLTDRGALHRLTAAEVRALRRLAPKLHDLCRRLDALDLPPTLVHGDLHPGNTMRLDGALAYFDWTDACVAHPFVDLHTLQWQRDDARRAALLHAYLEPWRAVASDETLRAAVELARAVTPLHHAVSYRSIVRGVEPSSRPELDATDDFLREAMARAGEL